MKAKPTGQAGDRTLFHLKLAGALFALLMAAWFVHRQFATPEIRVNKQPFASLGEYAADELGAILPGGRVQVVYDVPDKTANQHPRFGKAIEMQGVQALAFKARLAGRGRFTFDADVKLPRPVMAMQSAWPAGVFQSLVQRADTTLVLFSSLPVLGDPERALIQQRKGKLVVVGMALPAIQPAVRARLVNLAVANRVPIPQSTGATESPADWVKRVYAVVVPESGNP
ncbi:MAG: hypothetical protein HZA92_11745 [Verrucomicrobia bacterium]|nr:hypothetical protein [Verrucomicrobiota bacterium]